MYLCGNIIKLIKRRKLVECLVNFSVILVIDWCRYRRPVCVDGYKAAYSCLEMYEM